ncbi:MAG: ATP-binding cassette domain-containing protein [Verrucomicrobiales bacterium]|nr:ATP-binding cassette domain-containing protein [Verrucomicrobiales bacterium]
MSEVLIQVEHVSKRFCRSLRRSLWYGLCEMTRDVLGRPMSVNDLRRDEFWAVHDVSFELRRGECLALIGHNGAGKTTLLKILNGLVKPDRGRVTLRGRVGALIALGAGFNPILTGRENVYINGAILGLTRREIDASVRGIIEFAEIDEFIDSPVQTYSSGMQVRLGFAISTALQPDILLLDEVLAVGDAAFRAKCYARIGSLLSTTGILFVSHDMNHIAQVADRAVHLRRGSVAVEGEPLKAITSYLEDAASARGGSRAVERLSAPVVGYALEANTVLQRGAGPFRARLTVESTAEVRDALLRLVVSDDAQVAIAEWNSAAAGRTVHLQAGRNEFEIDLGQPIFREGNYALDVYLYDHTHLHPLVYVRNKHGLRVAGTGRFPSPILLTPPTTVS